MKLLRLSLENFRGAPNGAWAFIHPTTGAALDVVHVTGPASSGKTAFLEAIVALKESVGAYRAPPDPAALVRRGAKSGRVEATWRLTPEEAARAEVKDATVTTSLTLGEGVVPELADAGLRGLFETFSDHPGQGKFEYFPAGRRLARWAGAKPSRAREATVRLVDDPDKYASVKGWLVELALADGLKTVEEATSRGILLKSDTRDSLAPYRRDIAALAPSIRLLGVEARDGDHELCFARADGAELSLDELSESEKQAVLFAVTFRRIGLSGSVVLIDSPELHLHVDAQLRFLRGVAKLGVDNQLFVATGSPEITRIAAPHEVITLAGRPA